MSEEEFWRCQPRKLKVLLDIHAQVHSPKDSNSGNLEGRQRFIDEVL